MANPIKSLLKQTAIYGLSSIVGRFLNYLLVPMYTTLFLANEYGIVTELYAYVSIFLILLTYGMETGYFKFCQNTDYKPNTVYTTSFSSLSFTSVLFIIIFYIFRTDIAELIDYQDNISYIMLLSSTVALDALSAIPFAKLRIENKAKRFAIIKFINIGINIGLNLFFLLFVPNFLSNDNIFYSIFYNGRDVGYIFLSNFFASLLTIFMLFPQIISAFKPYDFSFALLKKLLKYSYPLLFAGIAGMMSENFDRILLKYFIEIPHNIELGNKYIMYQIGIYGANVKIAVIMTLAIQAYRYAAEPFFFNYSKKSDSKQLYANVMKYFIIFGLLVFLGVTLLIDYVKYYINSSYHEGLKVVPILLISKLFAGIVFNLSIWYKLTNKTVYGAILSFIGAFVSLSLNVLLIPYFSYMGSAWASIFAYASIMIVSYILLRKHFPINYNIKRILFYFAAAMLLYLANVYLRQITIYYMIFNFSFLALFIFLVVKIERIKPMQILNRKGVPE